MSEKSAIVKVIVAGDSSGGQKAMQDMADKSEKVGSHVSGIVGKLAGAFAGFQAVSFLKDSVDEFTQDQKAAEQLKNVLENTTHATQAQVDSVEKWIGKTQNATGILDDHLRPALQNLVVATHDVGEAQSLMNGVMDIATAKGLDVETVSAAVAKAHAGNTGALQKLGIATKDASGKTLTFDEIMKNANKTFGGATATNATTAAGKMAIFHARVSDLQGEIGAKLVPVLGALATFVGNVLVPGIESVVGWLSKAADFVVKNKEYFIALGVGILAALVPAFIAWAASAGAAAIATIAAAAPVIAIGAAIAALVAGIIYAYNHFGLFRSAVDAVKDAMLFYWNNVLKPVASFIVDKVVPAIVAIVTKLAEWGLKVLDIGKTIGGFIGDVVGWFIDLPGKIGNAMSSVASFITAPFRSAFNSVAGLWNRTIGNLSFSVPDWVPGIGGKGFSFPKIPQLAQGGIIKARPGGTLVNIAEAGRDEAVVPLDRMQGNTINVHVQTNADAWRIAREVAWKMKTAF